MGLLRIQSSKIKKWGKLRSYVNYDFGTKKRLFYGPVAGILQHPKNLNLVF